MPRNTIIPEVQIIFKRWSDILLYLRQNTGYMDGYYWFVAGHVEKWESFIDAAIREAKEEAGVTIQKEDLVYVHTVHRKKLDEKEERVWVLFEVEVWEGEITNSEPEKCKELIWQDKYTLPKNMIPYIKLCIDSINKWILYLFWQVVIN